MNILFDLIALQPQDGGKTKFHGGGEYGRIIFEYILQCNTGHKIFGVYNKINKIPEKIKSLCKDHSVEECFVGSASDLGKLLKNKEIDKFIINIPHKYFDLEIPDNVDIIYTCHDLRDLNLSLDKTYKWYSENDGFRGKIKEMILKFNMYERIFSYIKREKRERLKRELMRANTIITVSNYSKYSILNEFPELDLDKVVVSYSPAKKCALLKEDKELSNKRYFLLISTNRFVKNAYRAIIALDNLIDKFPCLDFEVICVGGISRRMKKKINHMDKFSFLDYVEEEELEGLYKNAFAFIYPTLYEGFGYPPLEAMKYGTTVMASAVTSIPEICGNAVIYFNPYSIEEISNRILYILEEKPIFLKERGVKRYNEISKIQVNSLEKIANRILD